MNYHTTRHEVTIRRATAAQHTAITNNQQLRMQRTQADDSDDASADDDAVFPHMAQIVPRYNRIPTADGYIERRGNRDMHVHFVDNPPQIGRASRQTEEAFPRQGHRRRSAQRRWHWLVFVGLCLFVMLLGYMLLNTLSAWWQIHQDDGTYGRPRTFQIDAVVGHGGDSSTHPSHFIALNLNRHVVIVEIPAGDISKAVIYSGPTLMGDGQDLTPVTLSFHDVNGDGRQDMLVHILDQTTVFLNNGSMFVTQATSNSDGGATPPSFEEESDARSFYG